MLQIYLILQLIMIMMSGESDLEDLNGEERTDMPADGDNSDSGGEENTRGTVSTRDFLPQVV